MATPLRKLIAYVHEGNTPSRRVLEKTGFQAEGLLREHYLIDGMPVNEVIYGLLRKDR
jgi:RimJ/RimL family protein N-acetyltransferase